MSEVGPRGSCQPAGWEKIILLEKITLGIGEGGAVDVHGLPVLGRTRPPRAQGSRQPSERDISKLLPNNPSSVRTLLKPFKLFPSRSPAAVGSVTRRASDLKAVNRVLLFSLRQSAGSNAVTWLHACNGASEDDAV